jgi:hypothetical protein
MRVCTCTCTCTRRYFQHIIGDETAGRDLVVRRYLAWFRRSTAPTPTFAELGVEEGAEEAEEENVMKGGKAAGERGGGGGRGGGVGGEGGGDEEGVGTISSSRIREEPNPSPAAVSKQKQELGRLWLQAISSLDELEGR